MTVTEEDHTVLVAEDDSASRTATRMFLQRVGYRVGEAADGPATLREASLGSYDLVVLGSRGRSATRAGVLGSVNGAVHFHTNVPMLSFPSEDQHSD